jgi:hypothetical protein
VDHPVADVENVAARLQARSRTESEQVSMAEAILEADDTLDLIATLANHQRMAKQSLGVVFVPGDDWMPVNVEVLASVPSPP